MRIDFKKIIAFLLLFLWIASVHPASAGTVTLGNPTCTTPLSGDQIFYYRAVDKKTTCLGFSGNLTVSSDILNSNISGLIQQGSNITITGSGTTGSPYIISGSAGGVTSFNTRTGAVTSQSGDYNTLQVTENTNLYFTNARAIASVLTGYVSGAGTITASDSILQAIQKLNGNAASFVPTSRTISTTAPLTGGGNLTANRNIAIPASSSSVDGYLSSANFNIFTNKDNTPTTVTGISAAGTNQATATALTGDFSFQEISTVAGGTGVRLPTATATSRIWIVNSGVNTLRIYPATGASFPGLGANSPYFISPAEIVMFYGKNSTAWYIEGQYRSGFGGTVVNSTSSRDLTIVNSGVIPTAYGAANSIPQIVVGADGRVTNAVETGVSISWTQIYDWIDGLNLWFWQKPWKDEVNVAVPFPTNDINGLHGNIIDGVELTDEKTILLYLQPDATQNGLYYWNKSKYEFRRDYDDKGKPDGLLVTAIEGDINGGHTFKLTNKGYQLNPNNGNQFVRLESTFDIYKQPVDVATCKEADSDINIAETLRPGNELNHHCPDGGIILRAGMRVLVKDQYGDPLQNGIYIVPNLDWSSEVRRSSDMYYNSDAANAIVPVLQGTYKGTLWQAMLTTNEEGNPVVVTVNDSPLYFTEITRTGYNDPSKVVPLNGFYYPTSADADNVISYGFDEAMWSRVGDIVQVSGTVNIEESTALSGAFLRFSIPIPSNFSDASNAAGTASNDSNESATIQAYGPDEVWMKWTSGVATSNTLWSYTFQYRLLKP